MKSCTGRAKMIRNAKCARFSIPNRHLQPIIIIVKYSKLKTFTSMEIRSWFSSKKKA